MTHKPSDWTVRELVVAVYQDGDETKALIFDVTHWQFDRSLPHAADLLRAAAHDWLKTPIGQRVLAQANHSFNWGDLANSLNLISEDFWENHNVKNVFTHKPDSHTVVDHDEPLAPLSLAGQKEAP